uniref:Cell division cycle protein 20 homolog n=1 Tax=Hirondellea gigas TaxID=1518452 RepID=A0A6A7G4X9_9CRUS
MESLNSQMGSFSLSGFKTPSLFPSARARSQPGEKLSLSTSQKIRIRRRSKTPGLASNENRYRAFSATKFSQDRANRSRSKSKHSSASARRKTPTSKTSSKSHKTPKSNKTPTSKSKRQTPKSGDRFIPLRSATNLSLARQSPYRHGPPQEKSNEVPDSPYSAAASTASKRASHKALCQAFFDKDDINDAQVLTCRARLPSAPVIDHSSVYSAAPKDSERKASKKYRSIANKAFRVLDAPYILDDFFLNLLCWSSKNVLAVSLDDRVYLRGTDEEIIELTSIVNDNDEPVQVTSLHWIDNGSHIAIGTNASTIELWKIVELPGQTISSQTCQKLRKMQSTSGRSARGRIASLSWNSSHSWLLSGARNGSIQVHDICVSDHHRSTLEFHQKEVCTLEWNKAGTLLASGSADCVCCVWDSKSIEQSVQNNTHVGIVRPKFTFTHSSAPVKGISWCPWEKNLVAVGGGKADKTIRFYDTRTGDLLRSVSTKSQICQLLFSPHARELISTHGSPKYQLIVWDYDEMVHIGVLEGHKSRVLHIALDPTGTTLCTASPDETLRLWKVFEEPKKKRNPFPCSSSGFTNSIR